MERLYPVFLCVLVPVAALHLLTGTGKIPADPFSATAYLAANVAMLPGLAPIQPLMTVAWSLSYEMFFYVATALAVASLHLDCWTGAGRVALLAGFAAGLTLLTLVFGAAGPAAGSGGIPIRMLPFLAGMLIVECDIAQVRPPSAWLAAAAWAAAFVLQATIPLPAVQAVWLHTCAFWLLCAACLRGGNWLARAFTWQPARLFGNMSYSYYLVHGFVIVATVAGAQHIGMSALSDVTLWATLPVVFAATLVPSFLLFVVVEKPDSLGPVVNSGIPARLKL